jgi:hypothetical protein
MKKEKKKKSIDIAFEFFSDLQWPAIAKENEKIVIGSSDDYILFEEENDKIKINLLWFNRRENQYGARGGINKILVDKDIDYKEVFYLGNGKYSISYLSQIRTILHLDSEIHTLYLKKGNSKKVATKDKVLEISFKKFKEIQEDAKSASTKSRKYQSSVERYLLNIFSGKHINRQVQNKTNVEKGEFNFLIHRFNLETKKKKEDLEKYLNKEDSTSIQYFFSHLMDKDFFDDEFLRKLDDYFIREKLKDIIHIGKEILSLGLPSMDTDKAIQAIKLVTKNNKKIKQLETVWQGYFKKYLLYLIFSYKEIYSKIKLELDTEKKFPDFIGVNHYNGIDIIEIKTHLTPALVWDSSHKNFAFSSDLSKAIIQTMNYMDAVKRRLFKDDKDKEKITETTHEENLYRPRGIIIISSKNYLVKGRSRYDKDKIDRDFTKLRNSLHNIEILTFNEVIEIADNYKNKILKEKSGNDKKNTKTK